MANVATVKVAVKETLIGSQEPAQPTAQVKARFTTHAIKDAETGDLYMGPDQFIDAIAPPDEDYVGRLVSFSRARSLPAAGGDAVTAS
jgi:solute carrier family 25 (mitochondrial aspartate/glutamate transporter), member 12/13